MNLSSTDIAKAPIVCWLRRHRKVIFLTSLAVIALAIVCGFLMALPLGMALITTDALLTGVAPLRRYRFDRAKQPVYYWITIGFWIFMTFTSLAVVYACAR
ncbi:MAG: hypothetical protein AAF609_08890 [Cyanobacteria bacterium P01_C01_bin.120]